MAKKTAAQAISETRSKLDEINIFRKLLTNGMMISQSRREFFLDQMAKRDLNSVYFVRLVEALAITPVTVTSDKILVQKSFDLANQLGMKYSLDPIVIGGPFKGGDKVIWNGQSSKLGKTGGVGVLHEVCHWQVAPQSHRFTPDYGLGPAVANDREVNDIAKKRPSQDRELDENLAIMMGTMWMKHWGFPCDTFWLFDAIEANWDDCFKTLMAIGLVTEDFEPKLVARLYESSSARRSR